MIPSQNMVMVIMREYPGEGAPGTWALPEGGLQRSNREFLQLVHRSSVFQGWTTQGIGKGCQSNHPEAPQTQNLTPPSLNDIRWITADRRRIVRSTAGTRPEFQNLPDLQ